METKTNLCLAETKEEDLAAHEVASHSPNRTEKPKGVPHLENVLGAFVPHLVLPEQLFLLSHLNRTVI